MEARALVRPAAASLTTLFQGTTTTARRSHQIWTRTKRALNIAPHPSFSPAPSGSAIIFNPPSAEPSSFHTPHKFLPKSDPRRRHADLAALFATSSPADASSSSSSSSDLPPALNFPSRGANPRYHLSPDDVAEIRRLRAEDPVRWSVNRLARKFDCSEIFITICTPAPRDHKEKLERKLEVVKSRWGTIRTKARSERTKRKTMLFRNEL